MFGYVQINPATLSDEERARYKAAYCGLCQALKQRHGQLSRMGLTYDMTFLILMLSSLYEPNTVSDSRRCVAHPTQTHPFVENCVIDYAADMTVALTYHKCQDDWQDEKRLSGLSYGALLRKHYRQVMERWPRQCQVIEASLQKLTQVEQENSSADEAAKAFADLLGEVFVYMQDEWEAPLRKFGTELGRFIYMMDAVMDYQKDVKKHSYNPLISLEKTPEEMREPLMVLMGTATQTFEKLPLEQDLNLMRSILYGGVWQSFNQKYKQEGGACSNGSGPV